MPTPQPTETVPPTVSRAWLVRHRVCPISRDADGHILAIAEPGCPADAVADLEVAMGARITVQLASGDVVEQAIELLAARQVAADTSAFAESDDVADARELADRPPVVRYVNLVLREAYNRGASDIHLEAIRGGMVVRLRIDGVLTAAPDPPRGLHAGVVSRLKSIADLDVADMRRPQDGRVRVRLPERDLDIRVSTIPTVFGESVVLRLLSHGEGQLGLSQLGLPAPILHAVTVALQRPHGLFLVSGPTGSGKTTTLYAALQRRSADREKIITVEDPVEYELPGVTQIQVNRNAGVTFAAALRATLRQDPDVILIGELRDRETAEIAVQAALTGHLVLATLHTNDALAAVPRLLDLGVPDFLVAATLDGVLAQRLVRRRCTMCTAPEGSSRQSVETASRSAFRGESDDECSTCGSSGYAGRTGVFEFLGIHEPLRRAIAAGAPAQELVSLATDSGYRPMHEHANSLVDAGITTMEEVQRVIWA